MNKHHSKIMLVGDGAVGSTIAYALTLEGIGAELGIIDIKKDHSYGDAIDLEDATAISAPKNIYAADYADCKDADLVVITAGVPRKPGETRLQLVGKNLTILKSIVVPVVQSGFNGIFVVVANPVDVLTYATWKLSGFPKDRVIGAGTALDSSRIRVALAKELGIADARSVHAYVLGEHGDSQVAAYSAATVGGTPLLTYASAKGVSTNRLHEIEEDVKHKGGTIIAKKGATFYGIGAATARLCKAILNDEQSVIITSAYLDGQYGIHNVFTGVPSVVGGDGLKEIIEMDLSTEERAQLQHSATVLRGVLDDALKEAGIPD